MRIVTAQPDDFSAWLALAAEVEPLFGPMVADPGFHAALQRSFARGSAFCVREANGPPGAPLLAGLLWSAHPPQYEIGWLAVAAHARGRGLGRLLSEHALKLVTPPAEVRVVTFATDDPDGEPARRLYERLGFRPAEPAPANPAGRACQVFRRRVVAERP